MGQIVLVEDTRNKVGLHDLKNEYFERKGIKVVRSKLFVGDYALLNNMSICIDTKMSLGELYGDMYQQHERFRAEADRAAENGIKLVILVENKDGISTVDDIINWKNPQLKKSRPKGKKPPVPNDTFIKALKTFSERHGVIFKFISPESSGRAVIYLLTGIDLGK